MCELPLVEGGVGLHLKYELEDGAEHWMLGGGADAVCYIRMGHGGLLYLNGVDFVASDIDHIVATALDMEHALIIEVTCIGSCEGAVNEDGIGKVWLIKVSCHKGITAGCNASFGGNMDLGMGHGTSYTLALGDVVIEVVGA